MATYLTSQPMRQSTNSQFATADRINSFCSSILAGLGVFGLAANGVCPSILTRPAPTASGETPAAKDMDDPR